ncbi:MAG: polyprenyl synthetase family protein [Bacteriovoracaceae bacterium]|nr:polyprenyl synthetase family protein [Bacteriovoracaceae bacterium]
MNLKESRTSIENNLKYHLNLFAPNHKFREIYHYALIPPGKLFRPLLVSSIYNDFNTNRREAGTDPTYTFDKNSNHALFMSSVEIHHAYTLIHDDLPCMDNDNMRRGKPSVHKKFGQWKALLAGDGLLNASYYLISRTKSPQTNQVIKLMSRFLGPSGLIQGQVIDLLENTSNDFEMLLKMHEYKTARLIQTSIMGSFLLLNRPQGRTLIDLMKLGLHMGLAFQFIDDLSELAEEKLESHERKINPWLNHNKKSYHTLINSLSTVHKIIDRYELKNFSFVIHEYLSKMQSIIKKGENNIHLHLESVKCHDFDLESISKLNASDENP